MSEIILRNSNKLSKNNKAMINAHKQCAVCYREMLRWIKINAGNSKIHLEMNPVKMM